MGMGCGGSLTVDPDPYPHHPHLCTHAGIQTHDIHYKYPLKDDDRGPKHLRNEENTGYKHPLKNNDTGPKHPLEDDNTGLKHLHDEDDTPSPINSSGVHS